MMRFDILSILPEAFASPMSVSILKRAISAGKIEFILHDIRQYASGLRRTVDDVPYGGGAGMVMKAEPIIDAVNDVEKVGKNRMRILLSPQGAPLTQDIVSELATYDQLIMVCGQYEGVDNRVREAVIDREISIGDYVLTGGELPALVVCNVVSRLVEGVLGNSKSSADESFSRPTLEYPQYTRPQVYKGMKVPEVLVSGNHRKIEEWRVNQSCWKTRKVRPDLLDS